MSPRRDADRVRRSPFAGTWYPSHPGALLEMVEGLLSQAPEPPVEAKLVALLSPHAGLRYSGAVAAAGYRLLEANRFSAAPETVLLLGPSHRVFFDALAVYPRGRFATPLGQIAVDAELAEALERATPRARSMPEVHDGEHSLEMQLPFLQHVLPSARILPVMMGSQSRENVEAAGRALARVVSRTEKPLLLVASSDLSHYESRERAQVLDAEVLSSVERFDPESLAGLLEERPEHACGGGPLLSVMMAARELGATEARILRYGDSGDVTGDLESVVSYLSAGFFAPQ